MRKCRQDKYLFLSQLSGTPMAIKNLNNANLRLSSYFSVREFSYFMLASQINKKHNEELN